jgi:hypothetical protein
MESARDVECDHRWGEIALSAISHLIDTRWVCEII